MPRVSTYPDASLPLNAADLLYLVQGGNSRKVAASGLRSLLAPLPQAADGVGQALQIYNGPSVAGVLPDGGTWFYHAIAFTSPGGTISSGGSGGFAAGGTTYLAAASNRQGVTLAWRIA